MWARLVSSMKGLVVLQTGKICSDFRETGGERWRLTIPQELPLTSLPQSDRYRKPFPTAQSRQPVIELTFPIAAELFWHRGASKHRAHIPLAFLHPLANPVLSSPSLIYSVYHRGQFIYVHLLWYHMSRNTQLFDTIWGLISRTLFSE